MKYLIISLVSYYMGIITMCLFILGNEGKNEKKN